MSLRTRSAILLVLILALLAPPMEAVDHDQPTATARGQRVLGAWWKTLLSLLTALEPQQNPKTVPTTQENGSTLDQNATTTSQDCERGSIMDPNGCPRQ
jgi:hypothetical protein